MPKRIKRVPTPTKDIHDAAIDMSKKEAQFLLEDFYRQQPIQQSTKSHLRCLNQLKLKNDALRFVMNNVSRTRVQMSEILGLWAEQFPEAQWARKIRGVGPTISAGLVIYIDIDKAKSASSIWAWAGQEPNSRVITVRNADKMALESIDKFGEKITDEHIQWLARNLNKEFEIFKKFCRSKNKPYQWHQIIRAMRTPDYCVGLKRVCVDIGNNFINHKSPYQELYRYRFNYETEKSNAGEYKARAARQLEKFNYNENKSAYKEYIQGRLPKGHIINSAKRWAIKQFLAHYYMVAYYIHHGTAPKETYGLDILKGHRKIHVPNWNEVKYNEK